MLNQKKLAGMESQHLKFVYFCGDSSSRTAEFCVIATMYEWAYCMLQFWYIDVLFDRIILLRFSVEKLNVFKARHNS